MRDISDEERRSYRPQAHAALRVAAPHRLRRRESLTVNSTAGALAPRTRRGGDAQRGSRDFYHGLLTGRMVLSAGRLA